jgi:hypothetical protein
VTDAAKYFAALLPGDATEPTAALDVLALSKSAELGGQDCSRRLAAVLTCCTPHKVKRKQSCHYRLYFYRSLAFAVYRSEMSTGRRSLVVS